uniref:Uncharacterized protein n=1 Tax=Chrysotila carterae TaxID=13221 RepID=A0A7S4BS83_CHRCT
MAAAASSSPQQKPQPPQQGWTATRFGIVRRPVLPNLVVTAEGAGSHNPSPRARSDAVKDANCDGATQPQDASKEAVLLLKASSSTSPRRRNITHTRRRTDIDVRHEAVPPDDKPVQPTHSQLSTAIQAQAAGAFLPAVQSPRSVCRQAVLSEGATAPDEFLNAEDINFTWPGEPERSSMRSVRLPQISTPPQGKRAPEAILAFAGLSQQDLLAHGLGPQEVRRLQQGLVVYSSGFFNLVEDVMKKSLDFKAVLHKVWTAFLMLLQETHPGEREGVGFAHAMLTQEEHHKHVLSAKEDQVCVHALARAVHIPPITRWAQIRVCLGSIWRVLFSGTSPVQTSLNEARGRYSRRARLRPDMGGSFNVEV